MKERYTQTVKKFWSGQRKLEKSHLFRFLTVVAIIYIAVIIIVEVVTANKLRSCLNHVTQLDEKWRREATNDILSRPQVDVIVEGVDRCQKSRTNAKTFIYTGLLPVAFLGYFIFHWIFDYLFPKK